MEFQSTYARLGRRCRRTKGFRMRPFFAAFQLLSRWLRRIKKGLRGRRGGEESKGGPATIKPECRLRVTRRSNSFYAEAIADCLEFIRKSSAAADDVKKTATMEENEESGGGGGGAGSGGGR